MQVKKNSTASKPKGKQETPPAEDRTTAAERRRWIASDRKAETEIMGISAAADELSKMLVLRLRKENFRLADGPISFVELPLFEALRLMHHVHKLLIMAAGEYDLQAVNTSRELAGQEPIRGRTRDQVNQLWTLSFCR
jgi:hypothetical protein